MTGSGGRIAGAALIALLLATGVGGSLVVSDDAVTGIDAGTLSTPPANVRPPAISGDAAVGDTLTADRGLWVATGSIAYALQWERCGPDGDGCVDVPEAPEKTYTVSEEDVGSTLRVRVRAENDVSAVEARSAPTPVVAAMPLTNVRPPAVSGDAAVGETLTADRGLWAGTGPIAYAYQWERCGPDGDGCVDVPEATEKTYTVSEEDVGSTLRVRVRADNEVSAAEARSARTPEVAAP